MLLSFFTSGVNATLSFAKNTITSLPEEVCLPIKREGTYSGVVNGTLTLSSTVKKSFSLTNSEERICFDDVGEGEYNAYLVANSVSTGGPAYVIVSRNVSVLLPAPLSLIVQQLHNKYNELKSEYLQLNVTYQELEQKYKKIQQDYDKKGDHTTVSSGNKKLDRLLKFLEQFDGMENISQGELKLMKIINVFILNLSLYSYETMLWQPMWN